MSSTRERQEMREITQFDEGIKRYWKETDGQDPSVHTAGRGLVEEGIKRMIPYIEEQVRLLESGATLPSQVPLAIQYLTEMQADALAYLTTTVAFSSAVQQGKLTRTAMRLANLIEENYRFEELEQEQPNLARSMSKKAQRWSKSAQRRKIMRKAADVAGIRRLDWTSAERLKLGIKLIEILSEQTGLIQLTLVQDANVTVKVLTLTEAAEERLGERHAQMQIERPVNLPMIHPPQPWTSCTEGGYLTHRLKKSVVRSRKSWIGETENADMPDVLEALNHVQATRWAINTSVLDVMDVVWEEGSGLGGLPVDAKDEREIKEWVRQNFEKTWHTNVSSEDLTETEKSALKAWKTKAREVYEQNATRRSKYQAAQTQIRCARELRDEEAIYFPHSLDFRGRLYPMCVELSPQSDDISKSLLRFADGKPLGENGAYWLHVHIANLFGIDKVSFADRIDWVREHEQLILDSGIDPLDGQRFWTEADDPWCALAACFEFVGYKVMGTDYVSHLPIAMDGSCSGIQHFSAMLRDKDGGRAVNLTKTDAPQDIYTEVQQAVDAKLKAHKDPLAKHWRKILDRKIVKRPCMTYAYSVTRVGIREQIADELRKKDQGNVIPGVQNWEAAMFLAPLVEEAIRDVVDRAAEAMDWLKGVSKLVSKAGVPTGWITPLGFPVLQPYRKKKGRRVKLWFCGEIIKLTLSEETPVIDSAKHASSVAPNFVHSMDATHLMMVVNRMAREGVTDAFAMIHDSFGVHACDVDELHYAIRDEFIKLYTEHEVLVEFYQNSLLRLPGEEWPNVPSPPEAGDLDLEEVRDADFFFA